jgi:hypothetical protein
MDETFSFDPAIAYNDVGAAELLSLTSEGLFYLNEKGKLKKGLCKKYKIEENDDGSETVIITLGESYWSDGIRVDAADFVYAWNRIMDPEFKCEAAALLFPVKNAVAVKNGDVRRDDIGFYSSGTYEITIDLNVGIDAETFLNNLANIDLKAGGLSIRSEGHDLGITNCTFNAVPGAKISVAGGGTVTFTDTTVNLTGKPEAGFTFAETDGAFSSVPTLSGNGGWVISMSEDAKRIRIFPSGFRLLVR